MDLAELEHTVQRWWVRGRQGDLDHAVIGLGQTAAGAWFVAKAERGTNMAWLAVDERAACVAVEKWLARRGGPAKWQKLP